MVRLPASTGTKIIDEYVIEIAKQAQEVVGLESTYQKMADAESSHQGPTLLGGSPERGNP